jgi:hypothetical protein
MSQTGEYLLRTPRAPGQNSATMVIPAAHRGGGRTSCEVAFISHYREIETTLRNAVRPSLVLFAFDDDGIAARAVLPAAADRVRCATVGRHDRVELMLPEDPGLALRQLAVLLPPVTERVRYRVLDLRTRLRMRDEFDQPLDGFEADGPMFVEIGRYTLLLVPRGDGPLRWPTDALEAWKQLPPRTYRRMTHHRGHLLSDPPVGPGVNTQVQVLPGVSLPHHCTDVRDARPVGWLRIRSSVGEARLLLDRRTARSGVLLGRYDRCETGGSPVLDDVLVSRVHALVVDVEGRTTVMDLGSINGVWIGEQRVRAHELRAGDEFGLGYGAVTVRWEPA